MRVVGREQHCPAGQQLGYCYFCPRFLSKVLWGEREETTWVRTPGPGTRTTGGLNRPVAGTRELRFLCVPWWWTSCLAAWPGLGQRIVSFTQWARWCRVQCLLLLNTGRWWHWGQHSPPSPPPTWALFIVGCNVQLGTGHWALMGREGVENVISQPL